MRRSLTFALLPPALLCCLAAFNAFATNTPTNLVANATSSSSINLAWTDNSSDEIGFTFMYDTSSSFPSPAYVWTGGPNVTSYTHSGRSAATTYFYRIKAEGATDALDSPFGNTAAATTMPSGLTATPVSNSQINLSWTGNAGNASITGYTVATNTSASFTGATYQFVSGAGTTSLAKTGLSGGTTYYFAVKAEGTTDAYDSPFTAFVSATAGTTTPANLTATAVSSSEIDLSWSASSGSVIGYTVATNTSASFAGATYQYVAGAGTTGLNKTGLAAATTYYFAVKAEGTTDALDSPFTGFVSATTTGSQPPPSGLAISPYLFGENAWMPDWIGSVRYWGDLDLHWGDIHASGVGIMRYGGISVDRDANPALQATLDQYVAMVDHMRGIGVEPVLQVPFWHYTYSAQQAAQIVDYVNNQQHRAVKYWVIGNEPDYAYGYTSAAQIGPYLRSYAAAMKDADSTIKIIGPELASYSQSIFDGLTDPTGSPDYDITAPVPGKTYYYVDIVSFHHYNGLNGNNVTTRDPVVNSLTAGSFNGNVAHLKSRLASCNSHWSRSGDNALQLAVTEANVNYNNASGDNVYLYGAKSFLGGQWWAEFLGTAARDGVDMITFWSVIEGNPELGYLGADGSKQPSYYHFQMMAQNFRGAVADTTSSQSLVKTFASKATDQIAVVLINQEENAGFPYTVRLDTGTVSGTNALKVKVDAGLPIESSGTIDRQSTVLLVFDASGTLKKRIEYKLFGHADSGLPPQVTNY